MSKKKNQPIASEPINLGNIEYKKVKFILSNGKEFEAFSTSKKNPVYSGAAPDDHPAWSKKAAVVSNVGTVQTFQNKYAGFFGSKKEQPQDK